MQLNESMQDYVYEYLRRHMLELTFAPGSVLSPQELSERLNVSRSPIREALLRLQREGLVVMLPKKDTTVSRISPDRVRQEQFLREQLECACIRDFTKIRTFDDLSRMNDCILKQAELSATRRYEERLTHDRAFHRIIFERCGQLFSWKLIDEMSTHFYRFTQLSFRSPETAETVITYHVRMLQAIETNRAGDAAALFCEHLQLHNKQMDALRAAYPDYFQLPEDGG